MGFNLIKDVQVHLRGTQEKTAKVIMNLVNGQNIYVTKHDLDILDHYVYEAYKPFLSKEATTKEAFFNDRAKARAYRKSYLSYIRYKLQRSSQEVLDSTDKLNVVSATKTLANSNNDWLLFQEALEENNQEPEIKKQLQESVTYGPYVLLSPEKREKLLNIARDKNRTIDKAIYQTLEPYIEIQEGLSQEEYLDNPQLRKKYSTIYQKLQIELDKEDTKGKIPSETTPEAIRRISSAARMMIFVKNQTSGQIDLPEVPSLETLSQLPANELVNLEQTYVTGLKQKTQQDFEDDREQQLNNIRELRKINDDHQRALDDIFASDMTSSIINTAERFESIKAKCSKK